MEIEKELFSFARYVPGDGVGSSCKCSRVVQIIPFTSNLVPISGLEKITRNADEIDDEDAELS